MKYSILMFCIYFIVYILSVLIIHLQLPLVTMQLEVQVIKLY